MSVQVFLSQIVGRTIARAKIFFSATLLVFIGLLIVKIWGVPDGEAGRIASAELWMAIFSIAPAIIAVWVIVTRSIIDVSLPVSKYMARSVTSFKVYNEISVEVTELVSDLDSKFGRSRRFAWLAARIYWSIFLSQLYSKLLSYLPFRGSDKADMRERD